jgi:hypothetical protein
MGDMLMPSAGAQNQWPRILNVCTPQETAFTSSIPFQWPRKIIMQPLIFS